ncbi:hypothetical protein [Qipengyuania sediminis]|uniref:hypothetical protein n=1 Tax=Qipengyuania sediminis TaxID=1532023 RepID=UPI0010597DF8|nr:hypothetical protein [Qipengyuania sediminis]
MNAIKRLAGSRLLRTVFWAATLFAFVMAILPQPPALPGEPSDKVQHVFAFAVLGLLAGLAYPGVRIAMLLVGLALLGGAIEIVQLVPALGRDSEIMDWIADIVAAAIALAIARLLLARGDTQ